MLEAYLGERRDDGARGTRCLTSRSSSPTTARCSAVDGVSLRVEEGKITAVLGANGAGKTSLLRTISGLERASSGRVTLAGAGHHAHSGRGHRAPRTRPRAGGPRRDRRADCRGEPPPRRALARQGERVARRHVRPLPASAGTPEPAGGDALRRRATDALARRGHSWVVRSVLLLDEPSLGLAPRITAQIMALVRELCDERGLAVLLVEQNARSALSIADTGIVLDLGRVVADEDPGGLPKTPTCDTHTWASEDCSMTQFINLTLSGISTGRDIRGCRARARAHLACHEDRELRPGRDADVHHVPRGDRDRSGQSVLGRSGRRARERPRAGGGGRARARPPGGVGAAAERGHSHARPARAPGGCGGDDLGQHPALVPRGVLDPGLQGRRHAPAVLAERPLHRARRARRRARARRCSSA